MMKSLSMLVLGLLLVQSTGYAQQNNQPPKVIGTIPKGGEQTVDSNLSEITVIFSKPMMDKSWSWSYENKDEFPQMTGQPHYSENNTRCSLPVKLEPNKKYNIWINTSKFTNFKDQAGNPVEPYLFSFKTK